MEFVGAGGGDQDSIWGWLFLQEGSCAVTQIEGAACICDEVVALVVVVVEGMKGVVGEVASVFTRGKGGCNISV